MRSKSWVKFWLDSLDDFAMVTLPDDLWRFYHECWGFAGVRESRAKLPKRDVGLLPSVSYMAWKKNCTEERVTELLEELSSLKSSGGKPYVVQREDGSWFVSNYAKRQAKISPTDRVRAHRKRGKETGEEHDGNAMGTGRSKKGNIVADREDEEGEEDIEVEKEVEADEDEDSPSVPKILDMSCAVLRITGTNPTTAQVEKLWAAGITEERVMAWYKDKQHGWPSIRPSNAERPDPWLSQVLEHLPNYRTHAERLSDSMDAHGVEH